ncbi:MAG: FAD-dependent oxidoreductase [Oscillospiraceae bacterium]|nr:FAD-dependent oxidoreductase [Oscillospiraceae bacterium]
MERMGFFYDMTRCVGCGACQVACKEKNKLSKGDFCRRVDTVEIQGRGKWTHFSGSCNHCAEPACVAVCPTGAMYIAEDGTVQHRDDLCIGCARCVHHCPYGAVCLDHHTGYARKCDACAERRKNGQEPACVEACPMRALQFDSWNTLRQTYGNACGASLPFLPAEEVTSPSLLVRGASEGYSTEIRQANKICVELTEQADTVEDNLHIVVLGSGVAAVSAVKEIRRRNAKANITIITRERQLPYARPMLSKGMTAGFSVNGYPILQEKWLQENDVTYIGNAEMRSIDRKKHVITLANGENHRYDKCIYALGADCFTPPIPGRQLRGVFTLRSDCDIDQMRHAMLSARKVVIVGGGITGMELAWELNRSGLEVTILDVLPQLMDRFLDIRTSQRLREIVESEGITVKTGVSIRAIEGCNKVEYVVLDDGTMYDADLIVLSTGYRANTALAQAAGISVGQAVLVDRRMQTSDADVYACGDCTDCGAMTWVQAAEQGRIAGANALGAELSFESEEEPVMVHTANTSLLAVGDMGKRTDRKYQFVYASAVRDADRFYVNPKKTHCQNTEFTFCFSDNRLVGAVLLGNLEQMLMAERGVKESWDMAKLKEYAAERGVVIHGE